MPLEIKPDNFLPCISVSLCEHHLSSSTHQDEPQHQAYLCTISLSDAQHSWLDQKVKILSTRIL